MRTIDFRLGLAAAMTLTLSAPMLMALALTVPAQAAPVAPHPPVNPGAAFQDCPDCPDMVVIPPGRFVMGSTEQERAALGVPAPFGPMETPRHEVSIAYRFAVARYSVTFTEWDACVADGGCNGYRPDDAGWGRGRRPVIGVGFGDAQAYVAWLRRKTGQPYRLLSEAEWEYAGRAGTTGWWPWGDAITPQNANYDQRLAGTAEVGSYPPNTFGLYDMTGNSAQWVQDCFHDGFAGAPTDGSAWVTGDCAKRNVRGGAWDLKPWSVRIAQRIGDPASTRNHHLGFRVARDLPQTAP